MSSSNACPSRLDSIVTRSLVVITTTQNTGSASSFAMAPEVSRASDAPSVTKLPVTVHAYLIKPAEGELFQASDAQVELAEPEARAS
jgi:hypothetical protein